MKLLNILFYTCLHATIYQDPYVQYIQGIKIKFPLVFPPFQGNVPTISEQANEIRKHEAAAEAFFNHPIETASSPYPKTHYDIIMMGYCDPPPQYGYRDIIPQSQEEHLDRTLHETDELMKKVTIEGSKKKKIGDKLLQKCNKMKKIIKSYMKDILRYSTVSLVPLCVYWEVKCL